MKRSIFSIVQTLGRLSKRWLDRNYGFRRKAVRRLVRKSGFTEEMSHTLLDTLFKELTVPKLRRLLKAELGDPLVLDGFREDPLTGHRHRAAGPRRIMHIFAGNVPNPAILSIILGMLVKSVNIGKVSSEDEGFLDIYIESLKDSDKHLGETNFLIEPNNQRQLKEAIRTSDLVVAYGNHDTIEKIRKMLPAAKPFVGYGHRVSFSVYLKEALTRESCQGLAAKTARDIWSMDQRGCLSPAAVYLQHGGKVSPLIFSQIVSGHLSDKGRWVTLYEEKAENLPLLSGSPVIYFKAFRKIEEVYESVKPFSRFLQAVALEADPAHRIRIAQRLSELGANRICRAGRMQKPPITWHHDGMPNLASWVRWTDLED